MALLVSNTQDGFLVVKLPERLSALGSIGLDEAQNELLGLADKANPPSIVLDFADTRFFDSTFIEVLFRTWNRLKRRGGIFVLAQLHPYCLEIMQTVRLDTLWPIEATVEAALDRCRKLQT